MADERAADIGICCLSDDISDLHELVWQAGHWWPDLSEPERLELARAAARWCLDQDLATLDVGTWAEPSPVDDTQDRDVLLEAAESWAEDPYRRVFLRTTPAGSSRYADRDAWPRGYRERYERVEALINGLDMEMLAHELAARLQAVAPQRYAITADGATVAVFRGQCGFWHDLQEICSNVGAHEGTIDTLIRPLLENVQQEFTEATAMPWPSNTPAYLGRTFADPKVRMTADAIELWYGDEAQPALVLPPIPLSALRRSS